MWANYIFCSCKFPVVYVCQKIWKLVDSNWSYFNYKRVKLFWPHCRWFFQLYWEQTNGFSLCPLCLSLLLIYLFQWILAHEVIRNVAVDTHTDTHTCGSEVITRMFWTCCLVCCWLLIWLCSIVTVLVSVCTKPTVSVQHKGMARLSWPWVSSDHIHC